MPSVTSIKLRISEKLLNREFRNAFFRAQAADSIALSIRDLRTMRNKRQKDLAFETGMQQSEISRIEQADYGSWTLKTLFKVAEALDARLRIAFDRVEVVIGEYDQQEAETDQWESAVELSRASVAYHKIARRGLSPTVDRLELEASPTPDSST